MKIKIYSKADEYYGEIEINGKNIVKKPENYDKEGFNLYKFGFGLYETVSLGKVKKMKLNEELTTPCLYYDENRGTCLMYLKLLRYE